MEDNFELKKKRFSFFEKLIVEMGHLKPPLAPSATTVWWRSEAKTNMAHACLTARTMVEPRWATIFKTLNLFELEAAEDEALHN